MNKPRLKRKLLLALPVLAAFYMIIRSSGIVGVFTVSQDSMMPNYAPKGHLVTFRWANFDRNDVISFIDTSLAIPHYREAEVGSYFGRIIAMGGERLEIANGQVLINGTVTPPEKPILFFWKLDKGTYEKNARLFDSPGMPYIQNTVVVALEESKALEIQKTIPMARVDMPVCADGQPCIWGAAGATWTMNNFGPVTVPEDCLFIMGDNRDNSEDSRHRGFVPRKDILGKVIN